MAIRQQAILEKPIHGITVFLQEGIIGTIMMEKTIMKME